jgi:hypothetical protein
MPNALAINTPRTGFSTYCVMNPRDNGKGLQQKKAEEHWKQFKIHKWVTISQFSDEI